MRPAACGLRAALPAAAALTACPSSTRRARPRLFRSFSQYTSTIEWLKVRLTQAGFGYRFISGSMPLKQRAKAINQVGGGA